MILILSHLTLFPTLCIGMLLPSHFSRVRLCATPWTAAYQASLSMGFSRQEHWSGLPFPSPLYWYRFAKLPSWWSELQPHDVVTLVRAGLRDVLFIPGQRSLDDQTSAESWKPDYPRGSDKRCRWKIEWQWVCVGKYPSLGAWIPSLSSVSSLSSATH